MNSLGKMYRYIIKKALVVIISAILGMALAGAAVWTKDHVYESSSTLYVLNNTSDTVGKGIAYNDLLAGQFLVKDYNTLITSRSVTEEVIVQLGLKMTSEELAEKITVENKNSSNFFNIIVRDTNAERAQQIANKVSDVFSVKAVQLLKVQTINVIDRAETPENPVGPNKMIFILVGAIAGAMVSVMILLLLSYINDRIETAEDVVDATNLPVVGIIPELGLK